MFPAPWADQTFVPCFHSAVRTERRIKYFSAVLADIGKIRSSAMFAGCDTLFVAGSAVVTDFHLAIGQDTPTSTP